MVTLISNRGKRRNVRRYRVEGGMVWVYSAILTACGKLSMFELDEYWERAELHAVPMPLKSDLTQRSVAVSIGGA